MRIFAEFVEEGWVSLEFVEIIRKVYKFGLIVLNIVSRKTRNILDWIVWGLGLVAVVILVYGIV